MDPKYRGQHQRNPRGAPQHRGAGNPWERGELWSRGGGMLLGRALSSSLAHDSLGKCSLHIEQFPRDRGDEQPEHLPRHHCPGIQLSPFTPSKYFSISQTSQKWGKNITLGGKGQAQLCFPLDTQLWSSQVSRVGTSCSLSNAGGAQRDTGGDRRGNRRHFG